MKKKYIQPGICVIRLQNRHQLLNASSVQTSGLDSGLSYDENGGDQGEAW